MSTKDAIAAAGGASVVAQQFKINPVSVYEWIREGRLPANRVIPLAELTQWQFTPHALDPVLYPNKLDGLPAEVREVRERSDRRGGRERRHFADRRDKPRDVEAGDEQGHAARP